MRGGLCGWFRKLAGPDEGTGKASVGDRSESRVAVRAGTQAETSPLTGCGALGKLLNLSDS